MARPKRAIHRHVRWRTEQCSVRRGHGDLTARPAPDEQWHPMNVTVTPIPDAHREDLYLSSPFGTSVSGWGARVTDAETGELIGLIVDVPPGAGRYPVHEWIRGELQDVADVSGGTGWCVGIDRHARLLFSQDDLEKTLRTLCRGVRTAMMSAEDAAALEGITV